MFVPLGFDKQDLRGILAKTTQAPKLTSGDGTPANANMRPVRALSASRLPLFLQPLISESTNVTLFDLAQI